MKVKFFGALTDVHDVVRLQYLGQEADLPEDLVKDIVNGGGCVIPSEHYDSVGITDAEAKKHPYPGDAQRAPVEFQEKRHKLLQLWAAFSKVLNTSPAPADAEPVAPEVQ